MATDREPPDSPLKIAPEGIDCASLQEIVDIDPASLQKILTALLAAQRTLHSERTRAGLATARQLSRKLGRPRVLTETQIALARRMIIEGATRKTVARTLKVAISTLYLALEPNSVKEQRRPKSPDSSLPPQSARPVPRVPGCPSTCEGRETHDASAEKPNNKERRT